MTYLCSKPCWLIVQSFSIGLEPVTYSPLINNMHWEYDSTNCYNPWEVDIKLPKFIHPTEVKLFSIASCESQSSGVPQTTTNSFPLSKEIQLLGEGRYKVLHRI